MSRLTRAEQKELNRDRVLESAGKLFRNKGFHAASVEEIADEAGFSRGVIYSQFGSKDDLFLALLEQRMAWRTDQGLELMRQTPAGPGAMRLLTEQQRSIQNADIPWMLAALEFRIHAARTPQLNRRYAELHGRSMDRLAAIFELAASKAGLRPRFQPIEFARFVAALDSGGVLERVAEGPGLGHELPARALWLALTDSADEKGE